jgi:hypothetical protein
MSIAYIKYEDVRLRLVGKVSFDDAGTDPNKMSKQLACRLIEEAEGQVEQDLSPRYSAPFVHCTTSLYKDLPDRPTKNIIRTLCELKACIRILETDFGSGGAVDAEKYILRIEKRYKSIITENILAKASGLETSRQWSFPPLPYLKKNWFNDQADDGYAGIGPLVTSESDGGYAAGQINDPAEDFLNGILDD